jgi:mannose-6-phosphate isomerase-like protein (cupin superfamily)
VRGTALRSRSAAWILGLAALLVSAPAAAQSDPPPVALGVFLPGATEDPTLLDAFAEQTGAMPAIVHWYQPWGLTDPVLERDLADAALARDALPMVSWEPWAGPDSGPEWDLDRIIAGEHDAWIDAWARDVADWGRPLLVRPMHEMNGDWVPWGLGARGNTADELVAAWHHMVDRVRAAGAANVAWVWCPNTLLPGQTGYADIWPGEDRVDWLCLDGYNWGPDLGQPWRSPTQLFESSVEAIERLADLPLMVGETASTESGGDKAAWIRRGLARLHQRLPQVRAIVWFNEPREAPWPIDSSPEALAAYRALAASPAFRGRPADLAPDGARGAGCAGAAPGEADPECQERTMTPERSITAALADLLAERDRAGAPYLEFLRASSLSAGLYVLPAGATDGQSPHTEDEVYIVLAGRSAFTAGEETRSVGPGDTIFVPAGMPHRLHDITEELRLIVVFAPPEGSAAP